MTKYKQIQDKIVKEVERSKFSKAEIAEKLGIKEVIFERYLTGNSKIRLALFANLCKVLNLNANEILGV